MRSIEPYEADRRYQVARKRLSGSLLALLFEGGSPSDVADDMDLCMLWRLAMEGALLRESTWELMIELTDE